MVNRQKILIVDDDNNIAELISLYLTKECFETRIAGDGESALAAMDSFSPNLILLDLMLPGMNGFDVCRKVREAGLSTPILMLTAREEETDKVLGLELGADDYITKPYSVRELMARVKANIRRVEMVPATPAVPAAQEGSVLRLGRVTIDRERATIFKDGQALDLTQREYDLICYLAAQPGKVFSREALMEHVWNYDGYVGDVRAVDVAVRRLRQKIEYNPDSPRFIVTKRGMGYLFAE